MKDKSLCQMSSSVMPSFGSWAGRSGGGSWEVKADAILWKMIQMHANSLIPFFLFPNDLQHRGNL